MQKIHDSATKGDYHQPAFAVILRGSAAGCRSWARRPLHCLPAHLPPNNVDRGSRVSVIPETKERHVCTRKGSRGQLPTIDRHDACVLAVRILPETRADLQDLRLLSRLPASEAPPSFSPSCSRWRCQAHPSSNFLPFLRAAREVGTPVPEILLLQADLWFCSGGWSGRRAAGMARGSRTGQEVRHARRRGRARQRLGCQSVIPASGRAHAVCPAPSTPPPSNHNNRPLETEPIRVYAHSDEAKEEPHTSPTHSSAVGRGRRDLSRAGAHTQGGG